ncbi:MAG: LysR substrate-binding domain-containing protein [Gammaproteobacteria bacterium]
MTLTELRYVVTVGRTLHFGRAAEACFVSQPTLSIAIKKLEEELGVILFERGLNEIRPTPVGMKVIEQAQQVLSQAEQIRQLANEGKEQLNEPLRLGIIYTIGPYLLPHLIPVLNQLAPDMPLIIREDFTENLRVSLKNGEIDVAILSLPFTEPGLKTHLLYEEPFMLAIPSKHRWVKRKNIHPEELGEETLLLLGAGNCFREQVVAACPDCITTSDSQKSALQKTLEGSSLETMRQMAASGVGITVLPCTSAAKGMDVNGLIKIKPFSDPAPSRDVVLAWRNSFPREEAVNTLNQAVQKMSLAGVKKAGKVLAKTDQR